MVCGVFGVQIYIFKVLGSHCGSAVKWWNEKINENKRSRVCSAARANLFKIFSFVVCIQ
jgi:hypothetical protein